MKLRNVLEKAIADRFSANLIVCGSIEILKKQTNIFVFDKYKNTILNDGENQYALFAVFSSAYTHTDSMNASFDIMLTFVSTAKLSKKHSDALSAMKALYNKQKYVDRSAHKIPLWHQLRYNIELNDVFDRNINLEISVK